MKNRKISCIMGKFPFSPLVLALEVLDIFKIIVIAGLTLWTMILCYKGLNSDPLFFWKVRIRIQGNGIYRVKKLKRWTRNIKIKILNSKPLITLKIYPKWGLPLIYCVSHKSWGIICKHWAHAKWEQTLTKYVNIGHIHGHGHEDMDMYSLVLWFIFGL